VDFFINIIYLSVYLSVRFFVGATGHGFGAILTLNGSNDVILQPLVRFGGHINIAPYEVSQIPPKKQFWDREYAFLSQTRKMLKLSYYRKYCSGLR